jgi:hypothetical protein
MGWANSRPVRFQVVQCLGRGGDGVIAWGKSMSAAGSVASIRRLGLLAVGVTAAAITITGCATNPTTPSSAGVGNSLPSSSSSFVAATPPESSTEMRCEKAFPGQRVGDDHGWCCARLSLRAAGASTAPGQRICGHLGCAGRCLVRRADKPDLEQPLGCCSGSATQPRAYRDRSRPGHISGPAGWTATATVSNWPQRKAIEGPG